MSTQLLKQGYEDTISFIMLNDKLKMKYYRKFLNNPEYLPGSLRRYMNKLMSSLCKLPQVTFL